MSSAQAQKAMSPRKASLEDGTDEHLPLYEEFQPSEGLSDVVPPKKASPMEVSDFLTHLLIDSRGMSTDGARRVAAMWTKGTGQELRSFPPAMYFEVFGKEDGWIVYREVHLAIHREKSKGFVYRNGAYLLLAGFLCFELVAVNLAVAGFKGSINEVVGVAATFASFFGLVGCICAFVVALTSRKGVEKGIEGELRRALNKNAPQHD